MDFVSNEIFLILEYANEFQYLDGSKTFGPLDLAGPTALEFSFIMGLDYCK